MASRMIWTWAKWWKAAAHLWRDKARAYRHDAVQEELASGYAAWMDTRDAELAELRRLATAMFEAEADDWQRAFDSGCHVDEVFQPKGPDAREALRAALAKEADRGGG